MNTNLQVSNGMVIVNDRNELRGKLRVFGASTFNEGDIIEIPENPQIQKMEKADGKIRVEIGCIVNNKDRWINLPTFTKLPLEGEGEGYREDFLKKHPTNAKIAVGDAWDQIDVLISLKKLKVSKTKAWFPDLVQTAGGWAVAKDEKGQNKQKFCNFYVFDVME